MICGYIENLTDWRVLPQIKEDRKSKSKKTKPREQSVVTGSSVGVGGVTKEKRSGMEGTEDDSEKADVALLSRKRRKKRQKAVSTSIVEPQIREKLTAKEESRTAAGVETTDTKSNHPTTSSPSTDAASKKFLSSSLKSSNPNYRIQRELKEFLSSPPPGLSVKISGKNVRLWIVTLSMPSNTIYAGETYKLRIQFPADYPTSPPSVFFLPPTPRHEHVYTNGDICLSLLGSDWRPIMTAQSVAQAIMSILCGAQRKSLPMDNARHAGNKPGKKQDDWVYHDDNC
jgi:ubiquitin-conjugating enzyme E2 W